MSKQLLHSLVNLLPPEGTVYREPDRRRWLHAAACLLDLLYEEKPKQRFDPYAVFAAGYIKSVSRELRRKV